MSVRAILTANLVGRETLNVKLAQMGEKIVEASKRGMLRAILKLQKYIVTVKLQGGNPLHHRTGNLQRATVYTEPVEQSGVITATVGTSNLAPYGKVHEYGGTFSIPEHSRTSVLGNVFTVRQHSATYPERSYLRSSLAENRQMIYDAIEEEILKGVKA